MGDNLKFVTLGERIYRYIRQFSVKNHLDATIEFITNSFDAYQKTDIQYRLMDIEYHYPNQLIFRDHATGLSGNQMIDCFLQVGNYTNHEQSRGFFSRGAKDCSAIGDLTFESIFDNKYSKLVLNSEAYGELVINDIDVNDEIRNRLKMSQSGLQVTLDLLANFQKFDSNDYTKSIVKLSQLREIFSNKRNQINYKFYNEHNELANECSLFYKYPDGQLLLDLEYQIPQYPNYNARFVVYKSSKPIEQPNKENMMEFGFIIKDNTSVYESSTLGDRFRWNPFMPYVFGYIHCDGIHQLLLDFDKNGSQYLNPFPIIDPSRLSGLNKDHPFIKSMLSIPLVRLDHILRELNSSISNQTVNINEAYQLLNELEKYGINLMETEELKFKFTPNYDSELAKTIQIDREKYIVSEKNYLMSDNTIGRVLKNDLNIGEKLSSYQYSSDQPYIKTPDQELVRLNENPDSSFENEDIDQFISNDQFDQLKENPYIYKLGNNGKLRKLYVYQRGKLDKVTNPEKEYVSIKNKNFQISFFEDINIKKRYIIDTNEGINVKINLHHPVMKKYFKLNSGDNENGLNLTQIGSTKSLVFFQELITEIFSEIILENNVSNNQLGLDSNPFNNCKKIINHRSELINQIQNPINSIFNNHINRLKADKMKLIYDHLDNISNVDTTEAKSTHPTFFISQPKPKKSIDILRSQIDNIRNTLDQIIE